MCLAFFQNIFIELIFMELTVILPFYNDEKYIRKCLTSIINQSYKDWFLIIINDASTDNSLKVVNEVLKSKKISKKKYKLILNKKNLGITKSLNKALKISKSKYIARADADDFYHKDRFKIQLNYLNKNTEIDVVGSFANIVDQSDKVIEKINMPFLDADIKESLIFRNTFFHSSIVAKLDFFKKNKFYNENYKNAQDYDLWLRNYNHSNYTNVKSYLIYYRRDYKNFSFSKMKCATIIRWRFLIREKMYIKGSISLVFNLLVDLYKYLKGKLN